MHYLHHYPNTCYTYEYAMWCVLATKILLQTDIINIHTSIAIFAHVCGLYTKFYRNPLRIRTLVNRILLIPTRMGFLNSIFKVWKEHRVSVDDQTSWNYHLDIEYEYKTQYIRYTSAICNKMNARQHFFWLQEHVENWTSNMVDTYHMAPVGFGMGHRVIHKTSKNPRK